MKSGNKKHAFTLAEIMIVVLILTILFAAFAPLITKRRTMANRSKYAVWSFTDLNNTMNAYYDAGDPSLTGELFFGATPKEKSSITTTFAPLSKVVIRSGPVTSANIPQRQIQFRYGRATKNGEYSGSWLMDTKNVLIGGTYDNMTYNTDNKTLAKFNLGIGTGSLNSLVSGNEDGADKAENNVALGFNSLNRLTQGKNNVAIGALAGANMTSPKFNTFVGYEAGRGTTLGTENTAVGSQAGANLVTGSNNTFIGTNAGRGATMGAQNVAIGYNALASLTTGSDNVAIGYNALGLLKTGSKNTAIGYNACSNVTTGSKKTCIGYNSGPKENSTGERFLNATEDDVQRTYIGGTPNHYGGDAVLEIHNVGGTNGYLGEPKVAPSVRSNTTTVINGNLIVRGRAFFTTGSTLRSYHYYEVSGSNADHMFGVESAGGVISSNQTSYTDWDTYGTERSPDIISSDRRLKNIGSQSLAGLKEISKLNVYNYIYKNDAKKLPQIGVIAQDLRKVFPNSVLKDQDGYLSIKWDEMFFASINAIKELDKKIVALVKRTTVVESQIAQLENENASLKSQVENLSIRIDKLKTK